MEEFICINGKAEVDIREKYFEMAKVFFLPTVDNNYNYCGKYRLVPLAIYKGSYTSAYNNRPISELKEIYEDFKCYVSEYEKLPENIINKEYLAKSKSAISAIPDYIRTQELAYEIYISENKAKTCLDILLRNYFSKDYLYRKSFFVIAEVFEDTDIKGVDDFYSIVIKFKFFDKHSSNFLVVLLRKAYALAEQNKLDDIVAYRLIDYMMDTNVNKPRYYTGALTKSDIKFIMKTKL